MPLTCSGRRNRVFNSAHQDKFGIDGFGRPRCRRCLNNRHDDRFALGDRVWVQDGQDRIRPATLVGFDKSGGVAFVRWGDSSPKTNDYSIVHFHSLMPTGKQ